MVEIKKSKISWGTVGTTVVGTVLGGSLMLLVKSPFERISALEKDFVEFRVNCGCAGKPKYSLGAKSKAVLADPNFLQDILKKKNEIKGVEQ